MKYNLNFTILRYGSIYSELNFYNNYIYQLIKKALETKKIIHEGDGTELREYIHASDAAKRSVDIIESSTHSNKCYILTGVDQIERKVLFEMIKEISREKIDVIYKKNILKNHYRYSPYSYQPMNAKKFISNPQIDLGQGILNCIHNIKTEKNEL